MDLQVILALITAVTCIEFVEAADASAEKIGCSLPPAKQGENATLTCIFKNIPKLNSEMTVNARGVKFADSKTKTVSVLALEFLNTPDRLNKVVDKHFEFGNVLSSDDDNWNVSVIFPRSNQDYEGNYDCQLVGPNNPSLATCPFTLDTLAEQGPNSTSVSTPVEQQNVSDGGGPLIDSKSQGSEKNTTVPELTREAIKTGGLQGGEIAGITVGVLVVVIVGVIICCCLKRRCCLKLRKKKARRKRTSQDIEEGEPLNQMPKNDRNMGATLSMSDLDHEVKILKQMLKNASATTEEKEKYISSLETNISRLDTQISKMWEEKQNRETEDRGERAALQKQAAEEAAAAKKHKEDMWTMREEYTRAKQQHIDESTVYISLINNMREQVERLEAEVAKLKRNNAYLVQKTFGRKLPNEGTPVLDGSYREHQLNKEKDLHGSNPSSDDEGDLVNKLVTKRWQPIRDGLQCPLSDGRGALSITPLRQEVCIVGDHTVSAVTTTSEDKHFATNADSISDDTLESASQRDGLGDTDKI